MSISTAAGTAVTLHTQAATALAGLLPLPVPVVATRLDRDDALAVARDAHDGVVSSFVGELSADLALVLADLDALAAGASVDAPLVSVLDVVRPALEAAAATLGAGVLDDGRRGSAEALLSDPESVVFALVAGADTVGVFALRVREGAASGGGRPSAARPASVAGNLGRINNVEMTLTVEIGRTRMSVRDVLALEPGAVVELDRAAGAPCDVLLNGRPIAEGEVVVVDQDYAVRITRILDVAEAV